MSTVDENNIGADKIRKFFEHHEIAILMLETFTIVPCKVIVLDLNFLCQIFTSFLDCSNKTRNNRAITVWGAIQKRSNEPIYKTD